MKTHHKQLLYEALLKTPDFCPALQLSNKWGIQRLTLLFQIHPDPHRYPLNKKLEQTKLFQILHVSNSDFNEPFPFNVTPILELPEPPTLAERS